MMEDDAYKPDFMDIMLAIAEFIVYSTFFGVIIYYTLSGMIESGISGLFVGFFIGLPLGFFCGHCCFVLFIPYHARHHNNLRNIYYVFR